MKNLNKITQCCLLVCCFIIVLTCPVSAQSQEVYRPVNSEYLRKRYEVAYEEFLKLDSNVGLKGGGKKFEELRKEYLDWGIRLSFLSKEWNDLDRYIQEYNDLEPNFSVSVLTSHESSQLRKYIENYLGAQTGDLVYVNKHPQNIDLAPATITVYKKEDIERLGARDLLDLIRLTSGFAELGDNNERIFGTRGSSNTTLQDVLFLINGHRISDVLTSSTAPDWISLDYVEQIELVKGPGSALYGGSAFNGVVNIITKSGTDLGSSVSISIGNGNSLSSLSNLSTRVNYQASKKLSNSEYLYLSASFKQSDGSEISYADAKFKAVLPDISGTDTLRQADLTGTEAVNQYGPSYNILMNYVSPNLSLTGNLQSSRYLDHRPFSFNLWKSRSDSLSKLRGRIDNRQFLQLQYDLPIENLSLKLSGDHFHKTIYGNLFSSGIDESTRLKGDEYRGTFNLEYLKSSDRDQVRKSLFVLGFESFVNSWFYNYQEEENGVFVQDRVTDQFTDSTDNNRNEYVAALYFQTEQHLVPDRLVATFGVRFNYHNEYSRFDSLVWGQSYSPRLALVFLPPKNKAGLNSYKFKLIYNSAFLPPPFLYRKGGIKFFEGRRDLQSQSIESGEFVLFGDLNKNFSYSALSYVNKIDKFIQRINNSYINESTERRVSGYEVELKYHKDSPGVDWSFFANYSSTRQHFAKDSNRYGYFSVFGGNVFNTQESLTLFPRSHFNAGLNMKFKSGVQELVDKINTENLDLPKRPQLALGANAQLIGKSNINNNYQFDQQNQLVFSSVSTTQEVPSALVFNALAKIYFDQLVVGCSLYNLTNKEYFLPSAIARIGRQRAEGRMIFLDFVYRFK